VTMFEIEYSSVSAKLEWGDELLLCGLTR